LDVVASDRASTAAAELTGLVRAIRGVVNRHPDWQTTAELVAGELEQHLPSPEILTPEQRRGEATRYQTHVLHIERDGSFSVLALVWRPGQVTPIHDHVTWCVFGVIQGVEHEELYTLDVAGDCLVEAGSSTNRTGEVAGFAPPGDIHRVRNPGPDTAISIHVYGSDIFRLGSSVRREYREPVRQVPLVAARSDAAASRPAA
jgi:predicted metal-dependent enzyme (double-stranded beta helix superfamily)